MGPFALMQRPPPSAHYDEAVASTDPATRIYSAMKLRAPPASIDFGDLIVATLPPADLDGSMQLTIGRSPDCDLVVHDITVSKHHAHITWDGANAVLSELGSINGTFVNGLRMKQRWTLRDADTLAFGDSHFVFLLAPTLHARLMRFTH